MKEWKNSKVIKNFDEWEDTIKDTKKTLARLLKEGYIKRFWDKKLKTWKYQHTPKGVEWQKNKKENQHD